MTGTVVGLRLGASNPNPCVSTTNIAFEIPASQSAELTLYDLRGRRVRTLFRGSSPGGREIVSWDGRDDDGNALPNGVYFYQLLSGGRQVARRLALLAGS